jgi:hypothetical protein
MSLRRGRGHFLTAVTCRESALTTTALSEYLKLGPDPRQDRDLPGGVKLVAAEIGPSGPWPRASHIVVEVTFEPDVLVEVAATAQLP